MASRTRFPNASADRPCPVPPASAGNLQAPRHRPLHYGAIIACDCGYFTAAAPFAKAAPRLHSFGYHVLALRGVNLLGRSRSASATAVLAHAYFALHVMGKPGRRNIDPVDLRRALAVPFRRERQPDGRIRHWIWVAERGYWLRVITEADGETVHNAFWDGDSSHE